MSAATDRYLAAKADAGNALLLMRMGDFYEAMFEDAHTVAEALEITLTKRGDVPMCGVPAHSLDRYTDVLAAAGHRVALV